MATLLEKIVLLGAKMGAEMTIPI